MERKETPRRSPVWSVEAIPTGNCKPIEKPSRFQGSDADAKLKVAATLMSGTTGRCGREGQRTHIRVVVGVGTPGRGAAGHAAALASFGFGSLELADRGGVRGLVGAVDFETRPRRDSGLRLSFSSSSVYIFIISVATSALFHYIRLSVFHAVYMIFTCRRCCR